MSFQYEKFNHLILQNETKWIFSDAKERYNEVITKYPDICTTEGLPVVFEDFESLHESTHIEKLYQEYLSTRKFIYQVTVPNQMNGTLWKSGYEWSVNFKTMMYTEVMDFRPVTRPIQRI